MRMTVLGGSGAWPTAAAGCSGYLVEHNGFRLLLDPGYGTFARLGDTPLGDRLDAVLVSHGHPDHCVDLNPLLRARALRDEPPEPLALYAPDGALDAVLALDRPGMLDDAYRLGRLAGPLRLGPFLLDTVDLPHFTPNVAMRLTVSGVAMVYTGDGGPSPALVELAAGADLLVAEATYPDRVPDHSAGQLCSAVDAGRQATAAGVGRLVLTHLWPGTDPAHARRAAQTGYGGPTEVARPGLVCQLPDG